MLTFRMRDGSGSIRLKHVIEDTDRHGNVRVYLRRPGHLKVRLRSQPGTEDFLAEYRAAMMGATPRAPAGPLERRGARGSFKWLCEQYYVSAEYQRLGDRTKYVRRSILDRICEKNGSKPYALMEPRHVRRMRDEMADRPEAANGFVKALRQVYAFAVEYELAQRNPARDVPYLKAKGDGFHSWTMEEVRQFEDHHPIGSKPRLALAPERAGVPCHLVGHHARQARS